MAGPTVGQVYDGYTFKGGNPNDKASWAPVEKYAGAGFKPLGDGMYADPQGRKYKEGPKGGFSKVGGPSEEVINTSTKNLAAANNALSGIDRVDEHLRKTKNIGPLGIFMNPTEMATLTQSVKDLQLKLKEQPYNLGVLNGPDLALLEDIVANPAQLKSAVFRQTVLPRLANLASIVGNGYREEAARFGALGGNPEMIPLYRSPRSKYSKEEWGTQGKVPPEAMKRGSPAAAGSKRPPLSAFQK